MTKDEALKMALEALEELHAMVWGECPSLLNEDSGGDSTLDMECKQAITAIKEALAQPELNPERFNNWTDMDNIKDHVRILEQRVDFMRERIEAMQKQEPMAWAVKTIGGYKWHSIHASKGASDKWLEYRIKEQAQGEEYEQVALYTKDAL